MARDFANIIDYVREQQDTFEERDVCRVDSLVLSWLSYFRLPEAAAAALAKSWAPQDAACLPGQVAEPAACAAEPPAQAAQAARLATQVGLPIKELYRADWFDPMCSALYDTKSSIELLSALAASLRFRDVLVCGYVSHTDEVAEQQFSAMTFGFAPRMTFVAYRGTDNTLVGWKEDFNMAFSSVVPSQESAVRYLCDVAARTEGRLWCGGHSKGGNLAVYAGVMSPPDVRSRLVTCFSHDGPGFSAKTMADERWARVDDLEDKTIPQSSVVGLLFENQEHDCMVVHSHNAGFQQHDPFSWEVDWRDFVRDDKVGMGASAFDSSINAWLESCTDAERERFVDAVFKVLGASGETTFSGIKSNWRVALPKMMAAAGGLEASERQLVLDAIGDVARAMLPM